MGSNLRLLGGSANPPLADAVAGFLGLAPGRRVLDQFPDGELHVEVLDSVRGEDVYLLQPTSPPGERHVLELLLLADACRRAGAARLTAVVPYLGYARQDRRASGREPVAARVVADVIAAARIDRIVAVDLHSPALEGVFAVPIEHLTAVSLLAEAIRRACPPDAVVVAPDLGAAKLADRYARALGLPAAIVHKTRISGTEVRVRGVTGDVRDRIPILVDDMITTGGTIEAAAQSLAAAGCRPGMIVAASHALLVGAAADRLVRVGVTRLLTTDSVLSGQAGPLQVETTSLAPLLGEAIRRLHDRRSLADLLARG
jgi:ribose-phosphate pyrophosphokinase